MGKVKKIFKNRILIFILGGLIFGTVGVYAATYFPSNNVMYDNKESGLTSTDVQGAIDELYVKCSKPDIPTANNNPIDIVTSGDGLYEDEYETGKYIYKGTNPKNYISFNDETWRIVSFEADGTIKIVKNTMYGYSVMWAANQEDYDQSSIKNSLNNTYYNQYLLEKDKQWVVSHNWNAGIITDNNDNLKQQIADENKVSSQGTVGLLTVSEYLKVNTNNVKCATLKKYTQNLNTCIKTNWLYSVLADVYKGSWLITATNFDSRYAYAIEDSTGSIVTHLKLYSDYAYHPSVYISSNASLVGNGTKNDPYRIKGNQ